MSCYLPSQNQIRKLCVSVTSNNTCYFPSNLFNICLSLAQGCKMCTSATISQQFVAVFYGTLRKQTLELYFIIFAFYFFLFYLCCPDTFSFFWLTFFWSIFLWDTSFFALQLFQTYILVEEVVVNEEGKAGIFSFWWGSNWAKCIPEQTGVSKATGQRDHQYVIHSLSFALRERWAWRVTPACFLFFRPSESLWSCKDVKLWSFRSVQNCT